MTEQLSLRFRSWAGLLGIVLIAGGLLLDESLVEATLIPDGDLGSFLRSAVLGGQLVLVSSGLALLAFQGVPYMLAGGAIVILGLIAHSLLTESSLHWVWDCSAGEGTCHARGIDHYYGTAECWALAPSNCKPRRDGLEKITFVTDPTNFVTGRFTDHRPLVEPVPVKLREPWDLEFLPDGTMLITEREGRVVHVGPGWSRTVLQLQPLAVYETGLMGLAVDPDFASNHSVYLYYTVGYDDSDPMYANAKPWRRRVFGRISRFALEGNSLGHERVLLDRIPGSAMHAGGRLEIGPDGKLYATTGDAHEGELAQDSSSLAGKLLRLNADGSVPADNPFPGSPLYSLGHRNPQGLAWHPDTGELFEGENGPDRYDELNRIRPGHNYGWPVFHCSEHQATSASSPADAIFPIACFDVYTFAPSGMTFVPDPGSPWYGNLFVAGMRGKHLRRYVLDGDQIATEEIFFVGEGNRNAISHRLRDVKYRDGSLYVIGDEWGLVRLSPQTAAAEVR